eukprot:PLAT12473.12.p1 GENE.PLAT12473.12~~PLAT12473.12.p1  ORF type:complete len:364 (-),score=2.12 PLAT12473.12:206-1297(-)
MASSAASASKPALLPSVHSRTPFVYLELKRAAKQGRRKQVRKCISHLDGHPERVNALSDAALAVAKSWHTYIRKGSLDCLKLLLEAGADVNYLEKGLPPEQPRQMLHHLVCCVQYVEQAKEAIALVLERGADVNHVFICRATRLPTTALYLAEPEYVAMLLAAGADPNVGALTGLTDSVEKSKMLLDAGLIVNRAGTESPLSRVARGHRPVAIELMKLLLDAGFDPDGEFPPYDYRGSPLYGALYQSSALRVPLHFTKLTALLLSYGADFRLQIDMNDYDTDHYVDSVEMHAASRSHPKAFQMVLKFSGNVDGYNAFGDNVISLVQKGYSRGNAVAKVSTVRYEGGREDAAQRRLHRRLKLAR